MTFVFQCRDFDTKSLFRRADVLNKHVTLLCGTKRNTGEDAVITILFDRSHFTESEAEHWWQMNKDRLVS